MVEVESAFLILAIIIFIGYFGLMFFKKTKISEILVLMLIGLFIGPIFCWVGSFEISLFEGFLPFFASFTLMVILFEGGMHLNFFKTIKDLPGSFFFTLIIFLSTLILTCAVWFVFTKDLLGGLLLGAILGGTSSAVIIPLINNTSAKEETKALLGIESALTDSLCVITAVTLAQIIVMVNSGNVSGVSLESVGSTLLAAFSVAAVVGAVLGLVWVNLLSFFEKKPYEYLLTLAALMFLYSVVETFGGNGAIAALVFGIVLGNSEDLTRMLRMNPRKIEDKIKSFQMEVSFLVRTFFFVYLGLLFKLKFLGDYLVVLIAFLLIIVILIARVIGTKLMVRINCFYKDDFMFLTTLCARGLAAAGLISFPIIVSVYPKDTFDKIVAIIFLVIFISNIVTTLGVFLSEKIKSDRSKIENISSNSNLLK